MKKFLILMILLLTLASCGEKSTTTATTFPGPDQGNVGNVEETTKKDCEVKLVKQLLNLEKKLKANTPKSGTESTAGYEKILLLIDLKLEALSKCK